MGRKLTNSERVHVFVPIQRFEEEPDGGLIIYGKATSEAVDDHGTWFPFEVQSAAFAEWPWKNIREMHEPIAVGRAVEIVPDPDGKCHWIRARISSAAADTVQKIREGILQAFSIAGWTPRHLMTNDTRDGVPCKRMGKLVISEVSLVDAPSNPETAFEIVRMADSAEEDGMDETKNPAEETPAAVEEAKRAMDPEMAGQILAAMSEMGAQLKAISEALSALGAEEKTEGEAEMTEEAKRAKPSLRVAVERASLGAMNAAEKAVSEVSKVSEKLTESFAAVEKRLAAIESQPVGGGAVRHDVTRSMPTPGNRNEEAIAAAMEKLPGTATVDELRSAAAFEMTRAMYRKG